MHEGCDDITIFPRLGFKALTHKDFTQKCKEASLEKLLKTEDLQEGFPEQMFANLSFWTSSQHDEESEEEKRARNISRFYIGEIQNRSFIDENLIDLDEEIDASPVEDFIERNNYEGEYDCLEECIYSWIDFVKRFKRIFEEIKELEETKDFDKIVVSGIKVESKSLINIIKEIDDWLFNRYEHDSKILSKDITITLLKDKEVVLSIFKHVKTCDISSENILENLQKGYLTYKDKKQKIGPWIYYSK